MTKQRPIIRITTNGTFTPVAQSCLLGQIVIACKLAGTAWTLEIKDKAAAPRSLVVPFTLTVPADGKPIIIKFDYLVSMDGGIDIVTAGSTPGQVAVWVEFGISG